MTDMQTAPPAAGQAERPAHPRLRDAWAKYPFDAETTRRYRQRQRIRLRPRLAAVLFGAAGLVLVLWAADWLVITSEPPLASLVVRAVAAPLFVALALITLFGRDDRLTSHIINAATVIGAFMIVSLDSIFDDGHRFMMAALPLISMCHVAIVPYFRTYPLAALAVLVVVNLHLLVHVQNGLKSLLLVNAYLLPTIFLAGLLCLLISLQRRRAYGLKLELDRKASIDPLTGVANRNTLETRIRLEEARRTRHPAPMSLLLIDLDHFKRVNDGHGHQSGDRVLQEVTARCQDELREIDLLARVGGEEFVVLLPNAGLAAASRAAERIRDRVAATPVSVDGVDIPVTVSIGCIEYRPDDDFDDAFRRADAAVYRAKAAGRNRVEAG